MLLTIKNLKAKIKDTEKEVLRGVDLNIKKGEIHVIMGPNGSGKSSLANIIMGHPKYEVIEGDILFEGESILNLPTDERAKKGIFLSFQHPVEIEGVRMRNLLFTAYKNLYPQDNTSLLTLDKELRKISGMVDLDQSFLDRHVYVGFSGGEKKKGEVIQFGFLKPKLAIFDEIDSGLDVDALKVVSKSILDLKEKDTSILLITHYQRILNYITPDFVHIYINGRIVSSGGLELAKLVEEEGYAVIGGR